MGAWDINGARVSGMVSAKGARVLYRDGWLYIAKTPDDVMAFECQEPVRWAGGYKVRIGDFAVQVQPPSCGCQRSAALRAMTPEQIIAAVKVEA